MKSVLISIQPKWCELIANGSKTIEVRKTKPKIKTPFNCYIYCTKSMKHLYKFSENIDCIDIGRYYTTDHNKYSLVPQGYINGKVIGEFVCDNIIEYPYDYCDGADIDDDSLLETQLEREDINIYAKGKTIYGWHISDLVIYDEPKELSKFYITDKKAVRQCSKRKQAYYSFTDTGYIKNGFYCEEKDDFCFDGCKRKVLTRPPQSWCYVEELR